MLRKTVVLISLILMDYSLMVAQWVQTNGPYIGYVTCITVSPNGAGGTNLFAGTDGGVFLSTNNGTSWTEVDSGLSDNFVHAFAVSPDGAGGTNLFAGTGGGVFLSTDNGTSWTRTGFTNSQTSAFAISPNGAGGTNLFAGTVSGVFLSTDNGTNWKQVNNGLTDTEIWTLAASPNGTGGTNLIAGTWYNRLFLSTDNGTSWTQVNIGDIVVNALAASSSQADSTNFFVGTSDGVFLSTDNGTSWTQVNMGLTNINVDALALFPNGAGGTNLFAGGQYGEVFLSTDNGTSWKQVNNGLTNNFLVSSFAVSGTNLFAGTIESGVWKRPLSEMITGIGDQYNEIPSGFELHQNYPNPFNPSTTIEYSIPKTSLVTLKVYDVLGREVTTIVREEKPAGVYEVQFDASLLSSGIYFYKIQAGPFIETKKMILLR